MHKENPDATLDPTEPQAGISSQRQQRVEVQYDNLDLTLRFLVGLLAIGGDEAARRLQAMQRQLDADPARWGTESTPADRTFGRWAWHLGVGLMNRGQKRLRREVRRGYDLSLRAAGQVHSASRRWGVGALTRPVRKPLEERLLRWSEQAARIAREGELEEQKGRALATGTLATLILEIMDEVAQNPELQVFVEQLVGQQGVGMATSIMDNARSVTLTADDAAEGLLRRLLRRTPRSDLPPSPVINQPQTMYEPTVLVEEGEPDGD